ncbi:MAG: N-acetylmuramoyl-L-alanine amidase [Mariprofundaceae bacterium]|nr:N-acetylmuramoyl-L-alanine amidase [Mariprofundaceae bacterium]
MRDFWQYQWQALKFLALTTMFFMLTTAAMAAEIQDMRIWTAPDHTRVVFDLSKSIDYKIFRLHAPERIVIDIKYSTIKKITLVTASDPVVKSVRYGMPKKSILRVVLDVKERVDLRSFLLKPMHHKPHRLVVDLLRESAIAHKNKSKTIMRKRQHDIIIAVDAGHGGEDPGAIGRHGLLEKEVTLRVAKKLVALINSKPGMHAILTREADYFVPLKKRVKLARQAQADLMISIHADAVKTRSVQGASVYTLAERGATPDRVAVALAAKENAADAIGGVVLDDAVDDPMVRNILGDMAKRDSLNSSQLLAENVLVEMKKIGVIKYKSPKRARFVVLGALEIPSVLVELNFISNPKQERKMKNSKHQDRFATALYEASKNFFRRMGMLHSNQYAPSS